MRIGFGGISVAAVKDGQLTYGPPQLDKPWYAIVEQKYRRQSGAKGRHVCNCWLSAIHDSERKVHPRSVSEKSECIHQSKGVMMPNEITSLQIDLGNGKAWTHAANR